VQLNALLKEIHNLPHLLQWQEAHKIEMEMEYLMLTITVPIFLTQDVIKKEIQH
jgi:hypothetical protein